MNALKMKWGQTLVPFLQTTSFLGQEKTKKNYSNLNQKMVNLFQDKTLTLPAIYISLYLATIIFCFIKVDKATKYKKLWISVHVIFALLLLSGIFAINFKGVLLDRLIAIGFLLTASATFAIYRKQLKLWQKLYFGFFLFYLIIAASTFFIDRIMFAVIASPLIICVTMPETRFENKDYEIREQVGLIAPLRLQLIKKGNVTENLLGTCNDEDILYKTISSLKVISQTKDTIKVILTSNDKSYQTTFDK